jgi:hypothetical protein
LVLVLYNLPQPVALQQYLPPAKNSVTKPSEKLIDGLIIVNKEPIKVNKINYRKILFFVARH